MTSRLSLGFLALSLAACGSDDRAAGGGGIEIPNGIEMSVVDASGNPAVGARVRVLAGDDWASLVASGASPVLDSAVTDAQGDVVLPAREGYYWIEVNSASGSVRASSLDGANLRLVLAATTPLAGQIPSTDPKAGRMRLAGTDLVSNVDDSGRFHFPEVVRGGYALVAEGFAAGHGPVQAGSVVVGAGGIEKLDVHLDTSALLLDDFADGDVAWSLKNVFEASYWWLQANDSSKKIFGISEAVQAVQSGGWMGVRVDGSAGTLTWANFGIDMGIRRLPSLARLTAIRMRVRGTGSWSLVLSTDLDGAYNSWKTSIPLDTTWKTVRLPVSLFVSELAGNTTALDDTRLSKLVFWTNASGAIDVDDVALEGVGLQDWVLP